MASKPTLKESTSSADLSFLPKHPRTADIGRNLNDIEICVEHAGVINLAASDDTASLPFGHSSAVFTMRSVAETENRGIAHFSTQRSTVSATMKAVYLIYVTYN